MDYERTMTEHGKNEYIQQTFFIDVESIPGVPGASGRVPGAPRHRKMMKKTIFIKNLQKIDHGSKAFFMAVSMVMTLAANYL